MKLLVALLGLTDYGEALSLQERILKLRQDGEIEDTLLLLEHPPTLTLGVRGSTDNIIAGEDFLRENGVNIYRVNRGGDVTYHGPGQIVGYPILDLTGHRRDVKEFFWKIEETFIRLLEGEYAIKAGRDSKYPGVWVGSEKITAIGCAVKRWVTMHGFAFNVNTALEHFLWINPCGITDRGVTSLQKILGAPQDMARVNEEVIRYFCGQFNLQPEMVGRQEIYLMAGREP
ncbi:MAG: lipoyl(octanoyl) transferase LipB [Peptococcaceae bacterium]|jgi:lipoyl(octanoyl) transferase|nr:lipoyl(octanoyl) transferase LipB [Peptococcaceae bacterium]MDH7524491.1 lipoyl(octanoyl) transferase LipB [Peptococcaceae bacterium]